MNLEQYLKGLRTCHDEMVGSESRLQKQFGVFDNYDIMLDEHLGSVVVEFGTLTDFKLKHFFGRQFIFDYVPKKVSVQISHNKSHNEVLRQHPTLILLHPRHFEEKTTDPNYSLADQHRNIAEVVEMIGRYVIVNKIPALFRASYLSFPEDMLEREQAVIYNPKEEQ